MVEFEIDGRQFRVNKLSAMQQFHITRKIAPLIPPLMPIFAQVAKDQSKGISVKDDFEALGPLLQPFADGLAGMSDEASEYIFNNCLAAVMYKRGENWIKLWQPEAKVAMVAELEQDVSLMIRLVVRVIQDSLAPFISGFLTNAGEPEPEARSGVSPAAKSSS